MKRKITLILALMLSTICLAQYGINYKAIVKDGSGNIITNDLIAVQFNIIQASESGPVVYTESHTPTTDDNGMIILNIGEGTPITNTFGAIDWASAPHFLKVEVNTGSGLVDMGTTEFKTVPYALNTLNSNDNVWETDTDDITNTNTGKIGFGVSDPKVKFHFAENEWFLFGNDTIGAGSKIMYMPEKNAFRIGTIATGAASTYWDDAIYFDEGSGGDINYVGQYSFATGLNNRAQGFGATAMGRDTEATNSYAFASGFFSNADGEYSTAMGFNTDAMALGSTALGYSTDAEANYSFAAGYFAEAQAIYSAAIGNAVQAQSYSSMAVGRYNVGGGSATSWVSTDPIFEIGIGTGPTTRANAMTVRKNGNVGIGTNTPGARLHVANGNLRIGSLEEISDGGSFLIQVNSAFAPLTNGNRTLGTSTFKWSTVYATNGTINTSDRRDKENINDLNYGLNEVMQLRPVSYTWKDENLSNGKAKLGLIAQDVREIINEVVQDKEWIQDEGSTTKRSVDAERMGIYYSDLIPVLVKAIQEQQGTIEDLKARIQALENR